MVYRENCLPENCFKGFESVNALKSRIARCLYLVGLLTLSLPLFADVAVGTVFVDQNGNSIRDGGEVPLAGVRVSNGLDIAVTDQQGRYELPVDGDVVLFVVKPAGYLVPVNEDQLPQFYYVHRPQGSPSHFRYRGVAPTGPLPDSIDFPLVPQEEPSQFDVLLFADPQPQTEVELSYIRDDVVVELIGSDARFGMTMGDILFDDLSFFTRYNRIIGRIGVPWYNVPGNHELNFDASSDADSLETFTRFYGPPYYSFEYANVVFIVLDNVLYGGRVEPTAENPTGRGSYLGRLDDRQMAWLTNEISHIPTSKLVFLGMHIPLMGNAGPADRVHTENGGEILGLLADHPHVYSVAGHTHTAEHMYLDETGSSNPQGRFHHHILSTVSGSWWSGPFDERGIPVALQSDGTPNGYNILTVDNVSPTVRFKAAGFDSNYQMRILFDRAFHSDNPNGLRDFRHGELFDSRLTEAQTESTYIYVNLFDGGPKSSVSFRIDDGEFTAMPRVQAPSPAFVELQNRNAESMKSWVTAYPSTHLWSSRLPRLGAGAYRFEARAIDEFGREHTAFRVLEVITD